MSNKSILYNYYYPRSKEGGNKIKGITVMNKQITEQQNFYARIAGINYIIVILIGICCVNFIFSKLIVPGNITDTINNISDNRSLFSIGVAFEIIMYLLVILLSGSLYITLKIIDKNLALLALLFRFGEALVGTVTTILGGLIPILIIKSGSELSSNQLQTLITIFTDIRAAGLDVVLVFIGIGGTLFFYLFLKSKYIPKILSYWGILTYLTMLILSLSSIVIPNFPESVKMIFFIPGALFEIIIGLWLVIKGINQN